MFVIVIVVVTIVVVFIVRFQSSLILRFQQGITLDTSKLYDFCHCCCCCRHHQIPNLFDLGIPMSYHTWYYKNLWFLSLLLLLSLSSLTLLSLSDSKSLWSCHCQILNLLSRCTTMKNLEVIAWKLSELRPF